MNSHLIKQYKYATIKSYVLMIVSFAFIAVFFKDEKLLLLFLAISIVFSIFQTQKILLEIKFNENEIIFYAYAIIKGKKEFHINIEQINEIDFNGNLIILYNDEYGQLKETFGIDAKPWDLLCEQIKELKLKHQEFENLKNKKSVTE